MEASSWRSSWWRWWCKQRSPKILLIIRTYFLWWAINNDPTLWVQLYRRCPPQIWTALLMKVCIENLFYIASRDCGAFLFAYNLLSHSLHQLVQVCSLNMDIHQRPPAHLLVLPSSPDKSRGIMECWVPVRLPKNILSRSPRVHDTNWLICNIGK